MNISKSIDMNPSDSNKGEFFKNKILISTSTIKGDVFEHSIVYVCEHNAFGAMGIIINRQLGKVEVKELIKQFKINSDIKTKFLNTAVHFGGPVDTNRGFILHSTDYICEDTKIIKGEVALTGTMDILTKIADGTGPEKSFFALGYAGWDAGQLEQEVYDNAWLLVDVDEDLLFSPKNENKWEKAMSKLGVDPTILSADVGHA